MSFFESIQQKHLGDKPLNFLWELKVTDSEYVELKEMLAKYARSYCRNYDNRFITVYKECALMIAEYWRREYEGEHHKIEKIFKAFCPNIIDKAVIGEFYKAAKEGAKSMNLEMLEGDYRTRPFDSLLYQGGLPMKLVTGMAEISTASQWDLFTKGLVNKKINFENLDLSKAASKSNCLRKYCDQLIHGVEEKSYKDMPFYCQNENDAWFLFLIELAKREEKKQSQQHPMKLFFEFEVDNVEKRVFVKYVFEGKQKLQQVFLENQGLQNENFFSVQVRKNGHAVDTFDYINSFCRYTVISKHQYNDNDTISVFLHNQEEPYLCDALVDVPHLLYRNKDGKYLLGNRLGKDVSLLLIPEGWKVEDEASYTIHDYVWGKKKFQGILVNPSDTDDIIVKGHDGTITFGTNAELYWTDIMSHPLYQPNILEPVYNAEKCSFALSYDSNDGTNTKRCNVQFRNKWQSEWSDIPSYGEIFARAIDFNGHFVTPIRFINIGEELTVSLLKADMNSCQIRVLWPYGNVSTTEGERKVNDIWEIKKENCRDPRKIQFLLTPNDNSKNQFIISVKAPFKDFSIVDIYGDNIDNNCWIPYSDIDKYQYHLVGQDVKEYSYGNVKRQLRWKGDKLHVIQDNHFVSAIPFEGSLINLFESREVLRSLLERTSKNLLYAEVKVQFILDDGKKIIFGIKESPFRPKQIEGGRVVIEGNNHKPIKYTGVMELISSSDPTLTEELYFDNETGVYHLPESIRPWGKTILIGRTKGRICPTLVDLNKEMSRGYKADPSKRGIATATVLENLAKSQMGDRLWQKILGWFDRCQKDNIPESRIFELECTSRNYKSLLCLAFQLYIKCNDEEERDELKEKLRLFSSTLAFQWYWLQPYLSDIMAQLSEFMNDPMSAVIQEVYINWAMNQKPEDVMMYLGALNNPEKYMTYIGNCFMEVLTSYTDWMKKLCVSSMIEQYGMTHEAKTELIAQTIIMNPKACHRESFDTERYVEHNQERPIAFFDEHNESGKLGNEQWLFQRVNAVAKHINKEIDLFALNEEIRRSIIFCCKSSNYHFIIALNNKLIENSKPI